MRKDERTVSTQSWSDKISLRNKKHITVDFRTKANRSKKKRPVEDFYLTVVR